MKAIVMLLLVFSLASGSTTLDVQAAAKTLKTGVYVVGKDLSPGLNKFTISSGTAELYVDRGDYTIIEEEIDSDNYYSSNQFVASLKKGDIVGIDLSRGSSPVEVASISKINLKKISNGFYEVGTDIPAGNYTINFDNPDDEEDVVYIGIYDKNYNEKRTDILYPEDEPYSDTISKGDIVYVYYMIGTISFTEKTSFHKALLSINLVFRLK